MSSDAPLPPPRYGAEYDPDEDVAKDGGIPVYGRKTVDKNNAPSRLDGNVQLNSDAPTATRQAPGTGVHSGILGRGNVALDPAPHPNPQDVIRPLGKPITRVANYDGRFKDVFIMALRHLALNLITLGFFRFWGRTEMRRYFWGHIRLLGSRMEYQGRGRQLFRGFIMVVVGVLVLSLGLAMLNFFVVSDSEVSTAITIGFYMIGFFVVRNLAKYWAWRFRLRQTTWRGVRLAVQGSAFKYLVITFGGYVMTMLSFGIMYPYQRVAPMRYMLNNVYIGDRPLECTVTSGPLIGKWAIMLIFPVIAYFGLIGGVILGISGAGSTTLEVLAVIAGIAIAALWAWLYVRYRVQEIQYLCYTTKWGRLRFQSELNIKRVFLIQGIFLLLMAGLVGGGIIASAIFFEAGGDPRALFGQIGDLNASDMLLAIGGIMLAFIIYSMVQMFRVTILNHFLIGELLNSLTLWNSEDLEQVSQNSEAIQHGGEGFAEFFDIDGGF